MITVEVVADRIENQPGTMLLPLKARGLGTIDNAICKAVGSDTYRFLHPIKPETLLLQNGTAHFHPRVLKERNVPFAGIIYVAEQSGQTMGDIITAGLHRAKTEAVPRLTLPLINTGGVARADFAVHNRTMDAIAASINAFRRNNPTDNMHIVVVVYHEDKTIQAIRVNAMRHNLSIA